MTDARPSGWEQKESATWCSNTHHWSDEHNDDHHLVAVYKVRDNEMNIEQGDEQGEGQGDEQGEGKGDEQAEGQGDGQGEGQKGKVLCDGHQCCGRVR